MAVVSVGAAGPAGNETLRRRDQCNRAARLSRFKTDLGVVRNDNPQPLLPLDCFYHGVFDLCVEALSDKEQRGIARDTLVKRAEYAAGGVPEYYILHREPARLAFFTRAAGGRYVPSMRRTASFARGCCRASGSARTT